MSNGGILEPSKKRLLIMADPKDVCILHDEEGHWLIGVSNLDDGIEIVSDDDRLWWPV